MPKNRKPISTMTWAEFHNELRNSSFSKVKGYHLNYPYYNNLLQEKFGKTLDINKYKNENHPYLYAFRSLHPKVAQTLPGFNTIIGSKNGEGKFQTIVDVYNAMVQGTEGGCFTDRYGLVTKSYMGRSLYGTEKRANWTALENFLKLRGHSFQDLAWYARYTCKERERLTKLDDKAGLEKLQKEEQQFIEEEFKPIDSKRAGNTAIMTGHLGKIRPPTHSQTKAVAIKPPQKEKTALILDELPSIRISPAIRCKINTQTFFGSTGQEQGATTTNRKRRSEEAYQEEHHGPGQKYSRIN